jgi:hypothetical protein
MVSPWISGQQHGDATGGELLSHTNNFIIMKHFFLFSGSNHSVIVKPEKQVPPSEEISEPLYPFEHDVNTMDGSEFLDDFARMKEQPSDSDEKSDR